MSPFGALIGEHKRILYLRSFILCRCNTPLEPYITEQAQRRIARYVPNIDQFGVGLSDDGSLCGIHIHLECRLPFWSNNQHRRRKVARWTPQRNREANSLWKDNFCIPTNDVILLWLPRR